MDYDQRFLNMEGAAAYIGVSLRWMRRHWCELVRDGVTGHRVPKDSPKGRLFFEKDSLDAYLKRCRINGDERFTPVCDSCGKKVNPKDKGISEVDIFGVEPRNDREKRWVCEACTAREKEMMEALWDNCPARR